MYIFIYIYIYIYMYMYIYIYIYVYIFTCENTHILTDIFTHILCTTSATLTDTYLHVHAHTQIHKHTHTHTHTYTHRTHADTHMYLYARVHICTHTLHEPFKSCIHNFSWRSINMKSFYSQLQLKLWRAIICWEGLLFVNTYEVVNKYEELLFTTSAGKCHVLHINESRTLDTNQAVIHNFSWSCE